MTITENNKTSKTTASTYDTKQAPKKFRCAACGSWEDRQKAHPIMVRQENVPVNRQDTRFIRTTEVLICAKCLQRYGRVG